MCEARRCPQDSFHDHLWHIREPGDAAKRLQCTINLPEVVVFREYITQFVHVYLDDIFIFSSTIEEHEKHLAMVFNKLCEAQLYLSWDKVDLYSQRMDCLGHIISDSGIHADPDKMQKIWDWQQPCNYHNIQQLLGVMQYLAHFLPDITTYTMPLLLCTRSGKLFIWMPLLDKCFESIKSLTCRAPILKPIDPKNPETIWVIRDGSKTGVSTVYDQGPDWQSCCPTGFLSKKFLSAQQNYQTHEHETIAILEALITWEDKLLGQKFIVVTDHKSLEYFKAQPHLCSRQTRWWEYISCFNFTIQPMDGTDNWVVDCLFCYYEADGPEDHNPDSNQKLSGLLHSLPIPVWPWQLISMDFMGPLPVSKGHDYLLVIIDHLTSEVHLIPTTTWVTTKEVAWLFLKEIVRCHGVPESIISDHNMKFTSGFWKELHRLLGMKLLMSTVFHLQTDGATNRANCSIVQILRTLVHNVRSTKTKDVQLLSLHSTAVLVPPWDIPHLLHPITLIQPH